MRSASVSRFAGAAEATFCFSVFHHRRQAKEKHQKRNANKKKRKNDPADGGLAALLPVPVRDALHGRAPRFFDAQRR